MSATLMTQAMEADGIHPADQILEDGIFRRIDDSNGKPGNKLIGYVCHGTAGYYWHGSKLNDGKNWSIKHEVEFTAEERKEYARQMDQARKDRAAAEEQRRKECRERSTLIWDESPLAGDDHPYLVRKEIKPHGVKLHKGRLVVPVFNADNVLQGLQYIDENGDKKFEPGTAVKGNFSYILGTESKPLYICEGFSTAATIHEITGATVVIAFNCGNLKPVAEVMKARVGGVECR